MLGINNKKIIYKAHVFRNIKWYLQTKSVEGGSMKGITIQFEINNRKYISHFEFWALSALDEKFMT